MGSRTVPGPRARVRSNGSGRDPACRTVSETNSSRPQQSDRAARGMSLRPLLRIVAGDDRFRSLAEATRAAAEGGSAASVLASASIRPYVLAALLDDPDALADRPALVVASDDIAARDLARDL